MVALVDTKLGLEVGGRNADLQNNAVFKLGSGDIMITNSLRVMHGCNSYNPHSGDRHLQLLHMDDDDVLSRIRTLRKMGVDIERDTNTGRSQ